MSRRFSIFIISLGLTACFVWFEVGKTYAERECAAHQVKCEAPEGSADGGSVPVGDQPYKLSAKADEIIKDLKKRNEEDKWRDDGFILLKDCSRVDWATWKKKNCAKRKADWFAAEPKE